MIRLLIRRSVFKKIFSCPSSVDILLLTVVFVTLVESIADLFFGSCLLCPWVFE